MKSHTTTPGATTTPGTESRFHYVDGLRGVAAMLVLLFHLHANLAPAVRHWFPHILSIVLSHGNMGVELFFVLSGFVIAHSVSRGERSYRYLARFALRRSIRLDPPLWAIILLEVVLVRISLQLFPALDTPVPSWVQILTNITYTQRFFGVADVVPVLWSLTYEVQFYIVVAGGLVTFHRLGLSRQFHLVTFSIAFCYSLAVWVNVMPLPLQGLFIDRWFQFALGIVAWMAITRRLAVKWFILVSSVTALASVAAHTTEYRLTAVIAAVASASLLVLCNGNSALQKPFEHEAVQFLGRISYSLYLIHLSIGWRVITLIRLLWGPQLSPLLGTVAMLSGVAASILSAWALYHVLDKRSMTWAKKVRLPLRTALVPAG